MGLRYERLRGNHWNGWRRHRKRELRVRKSSHGHRKRKPPSSLLLLRALLDPTFLLSWKMKKIKVWNMIACFVLFHYSWVTFPFLLHIFLRTVLCNGVVGSEYVLSMHCFLYMASYLRVLRRYMCIRIKMVCRDIHVEVNSFKLKGQKGLEKSSICSHLSLTTLFSWCV